MMRHHGTTAKNGSLICFSDNGSLERQQKYPVLADIFQAIG